MVVAVEPFEAVESLTSVPPPPLFPPWMAVKAGAPYMGEKGGGATATNGSTTTDGSTATITPGDGRGRLDANGVYLMGGR